MPQKPRHCRRFCSALTLIVAGFATLLASGPTVALDIVVANRGGKELTFEGRIVVKAQDNGLLFQTTDGYLWRITPKEQVRVTKDDRAFVPMTTDAIGKAALEQLPAGFSIYRTKNYVVCYNSSKAYAMWCGAMYERLHRGFYSFWRNRGMKLKEPEFPLVAVIFGDRASYLAANKERLGAAAENIVGYYDIESNRVIMCDLTEVAAVRQAGDKRGSAAQINEILQRKEATLSVSTIVHEATHQLAYNCGLHQRLADIPVWVAEGLALYFETPDLNSSQGWNSIGAMNYRMLGHLQAYVPNRPAESLVSLVVTNKRLKEGDVVPGYAESWGLTHYLLTKRKKQYVDYIKRLSEKPPLVWDTPEERLKDFRAVFGDDLGKFDAELVKHFKQLK